MKSTQEITQEIYRHLGGNAFRTTTGARQFTMFNNSLRFTIPRPKRIFTITLSANDLYDVTVHTPYKGELRNPKVWLEVYDTQLCDLVTAVVGSRPQKQLNS